ncbi:MAG: efflux RND transporter periplasmic adaptor subunit, partial [Verrucomicrobiota bacterium]
MSSPRFLAFLLLFPIFLTSCGDSGGGGPQPPQAFPVQAAKPILREITLTDTYTGRFVPVEEVELRARVSGYIESVHFDDGQKVEKGDLMFQIDPRIFDAELAAAEAEVKQGEARVGLAESNLKRVATLVETGAVSKEEADIRESERAQAEADLLASKARLEMARLNREFTEVRAPISGIADRYEVTPGNYVTGGGPVSTMLTTIVPHDPIHCVFEVDERTILEFTRMYFEGEASGREGGETDTVEIAVSDRDEFEYVGTID